MAKLNRRMMCTGCGWKTTTYEIVVCCENGYMRDIDSAFSETLTSVGMPYVFELLCKGIFEAVGADVVEAENDYSGGGFYHYLIRRKDGYVICLHDSTEIAEISFSPWDSLNEYQEAYDSEVSARRGGWCREQEIDADVADPFIRNTGFTSRGEYLTDLIDEQTLDVETDILIQEAVKHITDFIAKCDALREKQ